MLTHNSQELLKNNILNCQKQDETGLNDFQKLPDYQHSVEIPYVGISRFRIPLKFSHDFGEMTHDALTSMSVNLTKGKTGINMSRLCSILQDETEKKSVSISSMKSILLRLRDELRDNQSEPMLENATLKFSFRYPVKQKSLKSDNWGWQYYETELSAEINKLQVFSFQIAMDFEYSSTCPCSLSMAKQYERDFELGLTQEGNGIGVAHGQRSRAKVIVKLSPEGIKKDFFILDLLQVLKNAIPTETQSFVKRIDEQAFAIINGSNPMFVEHVSKRLWSKLNEESSIEDWIAQIEHFESLHSHNATAVISKGIESGYKNTNLFY